VSEEVEYEAGAAEVSGEAEVMKKVQDPMKPSKEEVAAHEMFHLPYRSWCEVCVRGRGKSMPHYKGRGERGLPELHFDYMFLGEADKPHETRACLVAREAVSRVTLATMVPSKGSEEYTVDRIVAFLSEVGCLHGDVICKSDQEPAVRSLVDAVGRCRAVAGSGKWIIENSPVGASASNGVVERGIQSVQGQVRIIRLALERRYGVSIPAEHPLMAWAVEFAAVVLNRMEIGHDGKTAYQRLKGKRCNMPGIEFAEGVLWKSDNRSGALGKLSSAWKHGVYVGIRSKSGEFIVADKEGIWKARSIRRLPLDERWKSSNLDMVSHFPWKTREGAVVQTDVIRLEPHEIPVGPAAGESIPRQVYLRKSDFEEHGFTSSCPGCVSIIRGKARQGHSKACRIRMQDILKDTERFISAEDRINAYLADKLEKQDAERKRARIEGTVVEGQKVEVTEDVNMQEVRPAVPAEGGSSGSGLSSEERKRGVAEAEVQEAKRRKEEQDQEMSAAAAVKRELEGSVPEARTKKQLTVAEALANMSAGLNAVAGKGTWAATNAQNSEKIWCDRDRHFSRYYAGTTPAKLQLFGVAQHECLKTLEAKSGSAYATRGSSVIPSEAYDGMPSFVPDVLSEFSQDGRIYSKSFPPDIYDGYSKSFPPDIYDGFQPDVFEDADVLFSEDGVGGSVENELDPIEVAKAREEELAELEKRVYEIADIEECWARTGKAPIGVRWVDVRKKEGMHRSRLVAQDFAPKNKRNDIEGLYAAMPPLELVKLLMARASSVREKIMLIDIKKAHLYAPIEGDAYVCLPPERAIPGKCARLKFTLYGMRVAAKNWEKAYSSTMRNCGFVQGKANATSFHHREKCIRVVVHGDDFIASGSEENLRWLEARLVEAYPLKMRGILGPDTWDSKEGIILNRTIRVEADGSFVFEADSEHVPKMLKAMQLEGCNSVVSPGTKERLAEQEWLLSPREASLYRSVVARGNYLSQDRPDIRFVVKELCQKMSKPTNIDMLKLKRLCRYLAGALRVVQSEGAVVSDTCIDVFVDADWGGCEKTRLSTSGGAMVAFGRCVKVWSSTQRAWARSSGEAELYATTKGATEGLGLQTMCAELGIPLDVRVHTDSDACRGTVHRTGLGRLKHVRIEDLWLQSAVEEGRLQVVRIPRELNPADCLTKLVARPELEKQCKLLGFSIV
jgi:hypothetical protein